MDHKSNYRGRRAASGARPAERPHAQTHALEHIQKLSKVAEASAVQPLRVAASAAIFCAAAYCSAAALCPKSAAAAAVGGRAAGVMVESRAQLVDFRAKFLTLTYCC